MDYKSKVTIAVPVYGVDRYIARCARSLFEQTYRDIEYLFIDDCSPDKSIEILKTVMEDYPERKKHVRIIRHEKNRGLAAARNTGILYTETEFVLWVDSDDYIDVNTVECCLKKQQEGDFDMVLFDVIKHFLRKDVNKRNADFTSPRDLTLKLLDGSVEHGVWGGLIRKSLYTDNNIRTIEGVNMAEDYMVTPKLAYCAKKVAGLHRYFYHYDLRNPNSYSNTFSRARCEQQMIVFENLMEYFKDDDELKRIISRQSIISINNHAKHGLRDGDQEYYQLSIKRLCDRDPYFIKFLSMGDRLFYRLPNVGMREIYIKLAYKIKKLKESL